MYYVRSFKLFSRHSWSLHETLGECRVSTRQEARRLRTVRLRLCGRASRRWRRQMQVKLRLGVLLDYDRLGLGAVLLSEGAEFLVRLVRLVHERIRVVQRWRLEYSLQYRHVLDFLVLGARTRAHRGRGTARATARRLVGFLGTGLNAAVARRVELAETRTLRWLGSLRHRRPMKLVVARTRAAGICPASVRAKTTGQGRREKGRARRVMTTLRRYHVMILGQ